MSLCCVAFAFSSLQMRSVVRRWYSKADLVDVGRAVYRYSKYFISALERRSHLKCTILACKSIVSWYPGFGHTCSDKLILWLSRSDKSLPKRSGAINRGWLVFSKYFWKISSHPFTEQHCDILLCGIPQLVKNLPAMQEAPVRFLDQDDPLERG